MIKLDIPKEEQGSHVITAYADIVGNMTKEERNFLRAESFKYDDRTRKDIAEKAAWYYYKNYYGKYFMLIVKVDDVLSYIETLHFNFSQNNMFYKVRNGGDMIPFGDNKRAIILSTEFMTYDSEHGAINLNSFYNPYVSSSLKDIKKKIVGNGHTVTIFIKEIDENIFRKIMDMVDGTHIMFAK